jgi:hypothetical protein
MRSPPPGITPNRYTKKTFQSETSANSGMVFSPQQTYITPEKMKQGKQMIYSDLTPDVQNSKQSEFSSP